MVEIHIFDKVDDLQRLLDKWPRETIASARRALQRAGIAMRHESLNRLRKQLRMKESTLKNRHMKLHKVVTIGGSIGSLEAVISYSKKPIPMLEFVRGNKNPIPQKGIPVKRRRKLKVEVVPGRRRTLQSAFIQTVKSKQVFKRIKAQARFKTQSIPSVGEQVFGKKMHIPITQRGIGMFQRVFKHEMRVRTSDIVKTFDSSQAALRRHNLI
jgi:hypothetical protein